MAPQKKKFYTRVWFWLLVIVALGFGGCITVISVASVAVNKASTAKHTVVYSVTGSGTADITYDSFTNGNSGTSQDSGASIPWSKTITGSGLFNIYSLNATLSNGGTVTCSITVDGKQLSSHTSTGQFAYADCTASAP
ncbi:MAG: MmpS family protein [Actinobacteria bacterium]|nr:MmpS family protein [Actinomycetota bacterium]